MAINAILVGLSSLGTKTRALGVGSTNVPLDFVIIDSASGEPLNGASILLPDRDYRDLPPKAPRTLFGKSGPDGHYRIVVPDLMVNSVYDVDAEGRLTTRQLRSVKYPSWELVVGADGYEQSTTSYEDVRKKLMGDPRFHADSVPPPIVLRLRRHP